MTDQQLNMDSGVEAESVLGHFRDLSKFTLGPPSHQTYIRQSAKSSEEKRNALKKKLYNTLFESLFGPLSGARVRPGRQSVRREVDGVLTYVYQLRCKRRFEEASKLERCLETLMAKFGSSMDADVWQVLLFLVKLSDTAASPQPCILGHKQLRLPVLGCLEVPVLLPPGPPCFGDCRQPSPQTDMYMQYPREIFEVSFEESDLNSTDDDLKLSVFKKTPGSGLFGDIFFTTDGNVDRGQWQAGGGSLFSALVQSQTLSVDVLLELPDLPDSQAPEIKIPRAISNSQLSVDEGYTRSDLSSSPSVLTLEDSGLEDSVWEQALSHVPSHHYTWERIGREPGRTERPYLSEAGPEAVDKLCAFLQHATAILDPVSQPPTPLLRLSAQQLVTHVLNLMIGVPSKAFLLNQERRAFELQTGLRVSGVSPESLESLLAVFLESGTLYHRLSHLARPPTLDSFYQRGLVFQAFTSVLRRVLHHYSAAVLSIAPGVSLLQLHALSARAQTQIRFLAKLCWCGLDMENPAEIPAENFPLGTELLSYLYQETLEAASSDHYPMMLSVLQTSCGPFTAFLQDWVFHGIYRDVYSEFMIQLNPEHLESRDRDYWSRGFELKSQTTGENLPLFIETLASHIFVCGKSVNLLRTICPSHFMCNVSEYEIPRISITYLTSDLHSLEVQCQTFWVQMKERARLLTTSRAEKKAAEEEAKRDLVSQAHKVAAEELRRFQEAEREKRRKVTEKKQKEFKRLKAQMEADLQRRALEREEERAEDRAYMARVTEEEEALDEQDQELEKQAREELVRFYSELSADAARREQRALWRVQRARLDTARQELLATQSRQWQQELQDRATAQTLLASDVGADLPVWAGTERDTLTVEGETLTVEGDTLTVEGDQETARSRSTWADRGVAPPPIEGEPEPATEPGPEPDLEVARARWVGPKEDAGSEDPVRQLPRWVRQPPQPPPLPTADEVSQVTLPQELPKEPEDLAPDSQPKSEDSLGGRESGASGDAKIVSAGKDTKGFLSTQRLVSALPVVGDGSVTGQQRPPSGGAQGVEAGKAEDAQDTLALSLGRADSAEDTGSMAEASLPQHQESELSLSSISLEEVTTPRQLNVSSAAGDLIAAVAERHQRMKRKLKTTVRLSDSGSATRQSEETQYKPHIQTFQERHATSETAPSENAVPHIKSVMDRHATRETEAEETHVSSIKFVEDRSATKQSEEEQPAKPHQKTVEGMGATIESAPEEDRSIPRMHRPEGRGITEETEGEEWVLKKPSAHGHVSQLSNLEYVLKAPRLKRREEIYANLQSESRDYAIRPRIRMHPSRSATAEAEPTQVQRPHIRSNPKMWATQESEFVDTDAIRRQKFQQRNVYGHSSDSSVQRLLYGERFGTEEELPDIAEEEESQETPASVQPDVWDVDGIEKYTDSFDFLNKAPAVDLLSSQPFGVIGSMGDYCVNMGEDVEMVDYLPLPSLIHKSMTAPLMTQISLINDTIVNHFLVDLKMEEHFEALRRYIFMADGDFAQILSDIILEKLASKPLPQELLNPLFLNSSLTRALQSSIRSDDPYAQNLSFALKYFPAVLQTNAHDTLDCLELRYKVDWPVNIIVTENCQARYSQVFSFMLQLRRVVWVLNDIWYRLKRDAVVRKVGRSVHMRKVQLYRQEMQYFVRVMQGYIAHQIVDVSWCEFQETLGRDVQDLDDLHHVHSQYLHKVIFRCLLNKKAAPVMKIIQDIFCIILKFRGLLEGATWCTDPGTGEITHSAFPKLEATYKAFKEYSAFLFKVVTKLAVRGYQPHLQELLLRLNFNGYYSR